jgi:hypothetical protein
MITPSLNSAKSPVIDEIIRQAELRIEAQLTAALAADQRAMTFAGLLFAGIAVLLGAEFRASTCSLPIDPVFVIAIGFTLAAACACWSAKPSPWHFAGNFPASWNEDVAAEMTLEESRKEMAANFQELLELNEAQLHRSASWMRASMVVALASAILGIPLGLFCD